MKGFRFSNARGSEKLTIHLRVAGFPACCFLRLTDGRLQSLLHMRLRSVHEAPNRAFYNYYESLKIMSVSSVSTVWPD